MAHNAREDARVVEALLEWIGLALDGRSPSGFTLSATDDRLFQHQQRLNAIDLLDRLGLSEADI